VSDHNAPPGFDIGGYLSGQKAVVDENLARLVPAAERHPSVIHEAMRYSLFAGGKRIRPILALATAETVGVPVTRVMRFACALEMIHTYSLIHDDLPAMDDDDYRRGQLTCHRKFGEAIAILAGNGLMNRAFQILAEPGEDEEVNADTRLDVIARLCRAIGTEQGVIAGQVVDLTTQGSSFSREELEFIHSSKTGALISASVSCAGVLCQVQGERLRNLEQYGFKVGLAFQIVDDILDIVASSEELGKTPGKDRADQKATYPAFFGLVKSREEVDRLVSEAVKHLAQLGQTVSPLAHLAHFIASRRF